MLRRFLALLPVRSGVSVALGLALGIGLAAAVPGAAARTIHVPGDFARIQAAIQASADGDTVEIQPGTYLENVSFRGRAILVTSVAPADTTVARATVIDGSLTPNASVMRFTEGEGRDSQLRGLTLTGGTGTDVNPYWEISTAGGGIYCDSSSPLIRNCVLRGNRVTGYGNGGRGGGAYCAHGSPRFENCIFEHNYAPLRGNGFAAMGADADRPELIACQIRHNDGDRWGGSAVHLERCGALLEECTITQNRGAGLRLHGWTVGAELYATRILYNSDGGVDGDDTPSLLVDCTIAFNDGGPNLLCGTWDETDPAIVENCTILGNGSSLHAGLKTKGSVRVTDTIIRRHGSASIVLGPMSLDEIHTITYCNIEGGWSGTGNIDADPRFCNIFCRSEESLMLASDSPCLGSGSGGDRMGAWAEGCEAPAPAPQPQVLRVPEEFPSVEAALQNACSGDTVILAPGEYAVTDLVMPACGVTLRGEAPNDSLTVAATALVGSLPLPYPARSALRFTGGRGLGRSRVAGITIRDYPQRGVDAGDAVAALDHCIIRNNNGAVRADYSSLEIQHCVIADNQLDDAYGITGGGINFFWGSGHSAVTDCLIRGNRCAWDGGGLASSETDVDIRNCIFRDNYAAGFGGGVSLGGGATLENCLLLENRSPSGAGIATHMEPLIINCTVSGNLCCGASGPEPEAPASATAVNCVFWGNDPPAAGISPIPGSKSYCDYDGGVWPGDGNLSVDPHLVDAGPFRALLAPGSPCIDAGDPAIADQISDWHPRWPANYPDAPRSDMGAYGGAHNGGVWEWTRW